MVYVYSPYQRKKWPKKKPEPIVDKCVDIEQFFVAADLIDSPKDKNKDED